MKKLAAQVLVVVGLEDQGVEEMEEAKQKNAHAESRPRGNINGQKLVMVLLAVRGPKGFYHRHDRNGSIPTEVDVRLEVVIVVQGLQHQ
jgi:hypothetical protein